MLLIDANAILRYILYDNADMANKVRDLITKTSITVRYEVLAEVVYVLNKVYSMPRTEIANSIENFLQLDKVETESKEALSFALKTYAEVNMDFVDCVLFGLCATQGHEVFTFDKRLGSMIRNLD